MLDISHLRKTTEEKQPVGPAYLCLHGHFYQPPRDDPFTEQIPIEPAATPYANFNEKITAECYRPNAEAGNFDLINFDLGPTLAAWLEDAHPDVYTRLIEADRENVARYGIGNAMAQAEADINRRQRQGHRAKPNDMQVSERIVIEPRRHPH